VENRAGAGGNIGAEAVYRADPDGYTLLSSPPGPLSINLNLYKSLNYDPTRFVPITVLAIVPNVITARTDLPANSVRELIAYAKANPGKVVYASQGNGSTSHLSAQMFASMAGLDLVHVPYKGEGPALNDLVAGQIQFMVTNLAAAVGFVNQGRLRALGVTSLEPVPQLPGVAPIARDVPGFENAGWFGFVVPTGTPKDIIDKIHRDNRKALEDTQMKARFFAQGMAPVGNSPEEMGKAMREESARWANVVRERKITVQ